MDATENTTSDAPVAAELPSQELPAADTPADASSKKRSREPDDLAQTRTDNPVQSEVDEANPSKRSRNDEGPVVAAEVPVTDKPIVQDEPSITNESTVKDEPAADDGAIEATKATGADDDQPKLSKNQLRKQRRQQRYEDKKVERRAQRKDKRHDKQALKRQERNEKVEKIAQELGIDMKQAFKHYQEGEKKKEKSHRNVPVAIVIDCDFEKYMLPKELISLAGQITRCYSENREGSFRAQLLISSWGGQMKERFETVMKSTHLKWEGVQFVEGDFIEAGEVAWKRMTDPRGGRTCPALATLEHPSLEQPKQDDEDTTEVTEEVEKSKEENEKVLKNTDEEVVKVLQATDKEAVKALKAADGDVMKALKATDEEVTKALNSTGGEVMKALKAAEEQIMQAIKANAERVEKATNDTEKKAEDDVKQESKDEDDNNEEAIEAGPSQTSKDKKPFPPFSKDSIVYLSADSPYTLDKLEPYTTYVIGGLVDRNREKFLCQRRAEKMGVRTAKLPIGEYLQMSSRKVLATNHVVEIMVKWLESGDWGKAFLEVIPKRKGGQLIGAENDEDQKGDEEDGDDGENDGDEVLMDAGKDAMVEGEKQDGGEVESTI